MRFLGILSLVLLLSGATQAFAQLAPNQSSNCSQSPQFGYNPWCLDTTNGALYGWNATGNAYLPTKAGKFSDGKVATLPTCAAAYNGVVALVTDSTSVAAEGQNCAGSSSNSAVAICLGSTWKCF